VGTFAATNITTWLGGYDLTGDLNQTSLNLATDPQMCTPYGSTAQKRVAGLRDVEAQVDGYWQSDTDAVDPAVFDGLTTLQAVTHTPTGTELDVAWFYQTKTFTYQMFGQVGEVVPFSVSAQGVRGNGTLSVGAVRGRLLAAKGDISATGATGSGYQIGAVASGQYLYAVVHCFAIGTSFTLQIQSDDNSGFTSPTTRMTLGSVTAVGGTWGTRVAGPVTDDWWRVNVSAVTGTSTVAVAVGVK
jgi:hypothetical protein